MCLEQSDLMKSELIQFFMVDWIKQKSTSFNTSILRKEIDVFLLQIGNLYISKSLNHRAVTSFLHKMKLKTISYLQAKWHQKFVQFCPTFASCKVGQMCTNFWCHMTLPSKDEFDNVIMSRIVTMMERNVPMSKIPLWICLKKIRLF